MIKNWKGHQSPRHHVTIRIKVLVTWCPGDVETLDPQLITPTPTTITTNPSLHYLHEIFAYYNTISRICLSNSNKYFFLRTPPAYPPSSPSEATTR